MIYIEREKNITNYILSNTQNLLFIPKIWLWCNWLNWFNSSPPSATDICQWTGSALIQIMACCLFDNKPLPIRPLRTNFSKIWIEIQNFSFMEMHLKLSFVNMVSILSKERWVKLKSKLLLWVQTLYISAIKYKITAMITEMCYFLFMCCFCSSLANV